MKCSCGKPTSGGAWCATCRRTVDVAIANVATYHDDLDTVRTRQTSYGGLASVGSIGKSQPMPIDATFLPGGRGDHAQRSARQVVAGWSRQLQTAQPNGDGPAYDTLHSACNYLARNLTALASMPWAAEFKADILHVEKALAKVVDRPRDAWFAGVCGYVVGPHDGTSCACACHEQDRTAWPAGSAHQACDVPGGCGREYDASPCTQMLYAVPGEAYVTCRVCGTQYDVQDRRAVLLEEARDRQVTTTVLARIVVTLGGHDVTEARLASRIGTWAGRGDITSHGTRVVAGRPRPTYRVGDVLDLLAQERDTRISRARRA